MRRLILALLLACAPVASHATVTTTTRSVTTTGAPTTNFTVPFHFLLKSDLKVTLITIATEAEVVQTNGVNYSVTLPVGAVSGVVAMSVAVTALEQLRIERIVPYTQTTNFKAQGRFNARAHEAAFDKTMMAIQQLSAGTTTTDDITSAINTHEAAADPHTGVYHLTAGLVGGQLATGGTAASENLTLRSTAHATKGKVILGSTSAYDEVNDRLGIGTASPTVSVETTGDALFDQASVVTGAGGVTVSNTANNGLILKGTASAGMTINTGGDITIEASGGNFVINGTASSGWLDLSAQDGLSSDQLGLITVSLGNDGYIYGSSATGDDLYLAGNSAVTNGNIFFGTASTYDQANDYFGIGTLAPAVELDIPAGTVNVKYVYGDDAAGDDLYLSGTSHATKGNIIFGTASTYDEVNDYFGIGVLTPVVELDVRGAVVGKRRVGDSLITLDESYCGGVVAIKALGIIAISLPAITPAYEGCTYTIMQTRASATDTTYISPDAADTIRGTCHTSVVDHEFAMAAGVDAVLSKADQNQGDYITLMAMNTGGDIWYVTGCSGTWTDGP